MGRNKGVEPLHNRATICRVNHFTNSAMKLLIKYNTYFLNIQVKYDIIFIGGCMKKNGTNKFIEYNLLFLICCFLGWFWEVLWEFLKNGNLINSGTMHGPWLPIYGSGAFLIYILLYEYRDKKWFIFMGSFVICTVSEYLTSTYLEYTYGMSWWNYTDKPFNINGKICLPYSIAFGLAGMLVIYKLVPLVKKIIDKYNKKVLLTIVIILLTLFTFDFVFSTYYPNVSNKIQIINMDKFK